MSRIVGYWIEEPIRHDYEGDARIAAEAATSIQTGKNLGDTYEMARAIALQSLGFVMQDVQRVGGATGRLRAAAFAPAHGIPDRPSAGIEWNEDAVKRNAV